MVERGDLAGEDLLELLDEGLQIIGGELGVTRRARNELALDQGVLEQLGVNAQHHVGEHLDEPAVGVPCEAGVARLLDEAADRLVVEAEVEDGVHHAWHGERGPGAHGDEQRVGGVAQALTHALLQVARGDLDLLERRVIPHHAWHGERGPGAHGDEQRVGGVAQALTHALLQVARGDLDLLERRVIPLVPCIGIRHAGLAGDGEPRGNGQAESAHLGQVGSLATQDVVQRRIALGDIHS